MTENMDEGADSDSDTHIQNRNSVYHFGFMHIHKKNLTAPCKNMNI